MKHLFIPYELALLAKEKEHKETCYGFYTDNEELLYFTAKTGFINGDVEKYVAAPMYQQIVDWFRDKHGIFIQIDPFNAQFSGKDLGFVIYDFTLILPKTMKLTDKTRYEFRNYYESLNRAIEEAFKLI